MNGKTTDLLEATPIPDLIFPMNVFHLQGHDRLIAIHWHDHLEWIYVQKGRAKIQLDDVFLVGHQGDVFFVNSQQIHGATRIDNETELYAIVVDKSVLLNAGLDGTDPRYFRRILDHELAVPSIFRRDQPVTRDLSRSLLAIIDEFRHQPPAYELFVKAHLFQAFALAIRFSDSGTRPSPSDAHENGFGPLFAHLRQNYTHKVTVDQAAQLVNLSSSQFCVRFKEITGKTFVDYVNVLRIEEAERLLEHTNHPVGQIAAMVGLGNTAYLCRVFKKYRCISPLQYRRRRHGMV